MHKTRILFLLFLLITALFSMAQNTMSPYSIFGPGELQPKGFGRSAGMGYSGIAVSSDSRLNLLNPASLSGIDSLHFILEMGVDGKYSAFRSQGNSKTGFNANLQYLAMGFRITDWWANALGISPFSSVGYDIQTLSSVEGSDLKYFTQYKGSGGIALAYWANAIRVTKNLSLGVNTSYIFGPLTQEETISQPDLGTTFQLSREDYFHSFYFEYGARYAFKIKKMNFSAGAVYAPRQSIISGFSSTLKNSSLTVIDSKEGQKSKRKLPENIGFGISAGISDRFLLAFDYQNQRWAGLKFPNMAGSFNDAHNFAAGLEFKPWPARVANRFYQNWTYRTGFNHYASYLRLNSQAINGSSVTLGIGIPLRNQFSHINISLEAGTKGTTQNGLIRERFMMGHLGFSINELWFISKQFY